MMTDDRTETLTIKKFFHNDPVERYNSYIDSCINEVWGKKEDMITKKDFFKEIDKYCRMISLYFFTTKIQKINNIDVCFWQLTSRPIQIKTLFCGREIKEISQILKGKKWTIQ